MIVHARTRSVNGHAIGIGIDARREHERAIIHKYLDRRDIANNAHVTNLVDGLPAHSTTAAGRSATLIGTGGDILQKVDMVGNDYALGQGFCFAASGALYIGAGQPTVRVTEMTVGGDQE